jgi:hypothetical protein
MSRHPRVTVRGQAAQPAAKAGGEDGGLLGDRPLVAVVYAPNAQVARWVEGELERDGSTVQLARTFTNLMRSLVEDPPPRPNVLVVDVDATSPAELMELHSVRPRGWFGTVVALGTVPQPLRESLGIDLVVSPPFVLDQLRDAIAGLRVPVETAVIPIIRDDLG